MIGAYCLPRRSGFCYATFLVLSKSSLPYFIRRPAAKLSDKIVQWRLINVHSSIENWVIGLRFYIWPSLLTTIPKLQALIIRFSILFVVIILEFFLTMTSIFVWYPAHLTTGQEAAEFDVNLPTKPITRFKIIDDSLWQRSKALQL